MILTRIGVASCAKVMGILYAVGGFLVGLLFTLVSLAGATYGTWREDPGSGAMAILFGVGAVVILPVFYGVMGAVGGVIVAGMYNLVARLVGGVEIEIQQRGGRLESAQGSERA